MSPTTTACAKILVAESAMEYGVPFVKAFKAVTALASLIEKFLLIVTEAAPDKIVSLAIPACVAIAAPLSATLYFALESSPVIDFNVVASARVKFGVVASDKVIVPALAIIAPTSLRAWAMILLAVSLILNLTPGAIIKLGKAVVSASASLIDSVGLAASVRITL